MMGRNHAISGAAAWVAVTASADHFPGFSFLSVEPWQMLAGAVVCAGAALLPDADHHNATIAHSVPVVGSAVAGAAGKLSGGHRHGMHSILAIVVTWFATLWIGQLVLPITLPDWFPTAASLAIFITIAAATIWALRKIGVIKRGGVAFVIAVLLGLIIIPVSALTPLGVLATGVLPSTTDLPVAAVGVVIALIGFAVKATGLVKTWVRAWLTGAAIGLAITPILPDEMGWFQICVTLGYAVHILGDFLTVEGINWFWPLKLKAPKAIAASPMGIFWHGNGYMAVPVLGHAGSTREYIFGIVLALYAVIGAGISLLPV